MENKYLKFPDGFLWGAATSAYQVEGNNTNDWSEWERSEKRIKDLKSKGLIKKYGHHNYFSSMACDHYNRFEEDFDIAKSLNHNAHRFSVEWSRIEPKEGEFDEEEIEHYRKVIMALKERGMEPFVTLWHWPFPLWVRDRGGWKDKKTVEYFARYAEKMAASLKDVKFWITINEPIIYTAHGYLTGKRPPQEKSPLQYIKVLKQLAKAHIEAYKKIKKINKNTQIGASDSYVYFESYKNRWVNNLLKKIADWWWNSRFLDRIKYYHDFIGLNYYFHNRINYGFNKEENKVISDINKEIYPEGIYHALKNLNRYNKKPIYITENGLADEEDRMREDFIKNHLKFVHQAIEEGVDVRGYIYWSLLDNFEWDYGFWPRFGLMEIDYQTMERKVRHSAIKYAEICKNNYLIP